MKIAFLLLALALHASSALALAPAGENFPAAVASTAALQDIVKEADANGQKVYMEFVDSTDLSEELRQKCTGGSRGGTIIAVKVVDQQQGMVVKSVLFGTTERAHDMRVCN